MKKINFFLIFILILFSACSYNQNREIHSFEDCVSAGFAIMESYPEQCSNGKNIFVKQYTDLNNNISFSYKKYCEENLGIWIESTDECENISKDVCELEDGKFNECASACRNDPQSSFCTLQCVLVCDFTQNKTNINTVFDNYGNKIDFNCNSWFDGCNNCNVLENGELACTKMFCETLAEPKCND